MDKFTEEETSELRRLVDNEQVGVALSIQGLSSTDIAAGGLVKTMARLYLLNTIMEKLDDK